MEWLEGGDCPFPAAAVTSCCRSTGLVGGERGRPCRRHWDATPSPLPPRAPQVSGGDTARCTQVATLLGGTFVKSLEIDARCTHLVVGQVRQLPTRCPPLPSNRPPTIPSHAALKGRR